MTPTTSTELFMALFSLAVKHWGVKEFSFRFDDIDTIRDVQTIEIVEDALGRRYHCKVVE